MIGQLELANAADVPALVALRAAVATKLTSQYGMGPWSRTSSEKGVLFDMRRTELFVARHEGEIAATLALTRRKPWAIDPQYFGSVKRPQYLLSMAVAPGLQLRGIGRECMRQVIGLSRQRQADTIRLDAYDAAAGAGLFYAKCGFKEVGRVSYRGCPLIYFELFL